MDVRSLAFSQVVSIPSLPMPWTTWHQGMATAWKKRSIQPCIQEERDGSPTPEMHENQDEKFTVPSDRVTTVPRYENGFPNGNKCNIGARHVIMIQAEASTIINSCK